MDVYSYFEENGTAYFSMEYVQGVDLKNYILQKGGKIDLDNAKRILFPIMDALYIVHQKGVIHRDIKPENIIIKNDNTPILLDFGAARYSMGEKSRSLDVLLTPGFAPREQYSRHGRQGPYTDVYALAATFYYAITGRIPPDSIDRQEADTLIWPSRLGVKITMPEERALMMALAVQPANRFQSMNAFKRAMLGETDSNVWVSPNPNIPPNGKAQSNAQVPPNHQSQSNYQAPPNYQSQSNYQAPLNHQSQSNYQAPSNHQSQSNYQTPPNYQMPPNGQVSPPYSVQTMDSVKSPSSGNGKLKWIVAALCLVGVIC